jgi:hypothetical protein
LDATMPWRRHVEVLQWHLQCTQCTQCMPLSLSFSQAHTPNQGGGGVVRVETRLIPRLLHKTRESKSLAGPAWGDGGGQRAASGEMGWAHAGPLAGPPLPAGMLVLLAAPAIAVVGVVVVGVDLSMSCLRCPSVPSSAVTVVHVHVHVHVHARGRTRTRAQPGSTVICCPRRSSWPSPCLCIHPPVSMMDDG